MAKSPAGGERTSQKASRSVPPLASGLVLRRVRVHPRQVVFVKGVIEASEGLAVVFAERGGDLTIATSESQIRELDATLRDLQAETGALFE
jgi:hypothetical protein